MNKLKIISIALALTFVTSGVSFASYGSVACQPIYGGGETCATTSKILLDKKVLNPQTTKGQAQAFVDNLTINDPRYSASQNIKFQLVVTNPTDSVINEVNVTDTFPAFVNFTSGAGTFDAKTKTLTFKVMNLNPNESRKYIIEGKIVSSENLPNGQGIVCDVVNQATAAANGDQSTDNSRFCIEKAVTTTKGGLPVMPAPKMKQTPATGPEMLPLLGLIPAGLSGIFLRRRSSK